MDKTKQEDLRVRKTKEAIRRAFEDMICEMDYFAPITTILYRQWVKDSKKMPLEDLIATATRLVCGGLGEYVKG